MSDTTDREIRTIFRGEAVIASAPFVDGARIELRDLGCYTSLDAAIVWIRGNAFREELDLDDANEKLFVVQGVERAVDVGYMDFPAYVTISPAGELLERRSIIESWKGRASSRCRWKRGDIVGCVHQGCYRIGVVLEQPPSVQWVREQPGPGSTAMDDVYLVGFRGDELDHGHPTEAMMFEPLTKVPEDLVLRLQERLSKYPLVESGRRSAQRGARSKRSSQPRRP
jgi:hypothetical protein